MRFSILILLAFLNTSLFAQKSNTLIPYRSGNLWGYSDYKGKIIIKPEYEEVDLFHSEKLARVFKKFGSGKLVQNYIDTLGMVQLPFQYIEVKRVAPDYMIKHILEEKYQTLQIKKRLKDTTFAQFYTVNYNSFKLSSNVFYVNDSSNLKWGLYNSNLKKEVTNCTYDDIEFLCRKNGKFHFKTKQNKLYGIIDQDGKVIKNCEFNNIWAEKNKKNGNRDSFVLITRTKKIEDKKSRKEEENYDTTDYVYNWTLDLAYEIVRDKNTGKIGLLYNKDVLFETEYDSIVQYDRCNYGGLYAIQKNKKWGVPGGVIPFLYDEIGESYIHWENNSLYEIVIKVNGNWGIVNQDNDTLVPFIFKDELSFTSYLENYNIVFLAKYWNDPKLKTIQRPHEKTGIYFLNFPERSIYNTEIAEVNFPIYYKGEHVSSVLFSSRDKNHQEIFYINSQGFKYCDD